MKARKLFVDQYGGKHYASSVKDLQQKIGGRVSKMYIGDGVHVGYVVGKLWCRIYAPVQNINKALK